MSVQLTKLLPSAPQIVLSGVLKGVYAAGTDYAPGDVVTYQGGTYIMHTDAAAGTAPTDTAAWQAINSPQAYVESINELSLVNTTTDNTISVDQNGNVGTDVSTDGAIHIENTGNTGIGLGVYTNIGATADAPLVSIKADNAAFDNRVVQIVNDGVGSALYVEQVGTTPSNYTNAALYVNNSANDGCAVSVYSNADVPARALVNLSADNAAFNDNVLRIDLNGPGKAIAIDHDDNGVLPSIDIDRDGNNAGYVFGMAITVDNAGVGGLVCGINFSGMSDTEPIFKFPSATPDADLSSKAPQTDAAAGFIPVLYGTTVYAMPVYALS